MFFEKPFTKKLALTGLIFVFLTISIGLLFSSPTGYEPSIYDSFPAIFWFLLIMTEIIGLQILINEIIGYKRFNHALKFKKIGIFLIFFANFLILCLPLKYKFYGINDSLTHLGFIKDILTSGELGASNFYPLSHIIVVFMSLLSNTNILKTLLLMIPIFYLLYVLSIFLLSQKISSDEIKRTFIMIFAIITPIGIYSSEFSPIGIGIFCIPLLLYLMLNNDKIEFSVLYIIICFFSVFLHPLISIYLILILITYYVSNKLYVTIYKKKDFNTINPLNSISLIIITLLTWIGSFWIFGDRLLRLAGWMSGELKNSYVESYQTALMKTGYSFFDTFMIVIKTYGSVLIYFGLFIIALIYIVKKIITNENIIKEQLFLGLLTLIFGAISITFFVVGFNVAANPLRLTTLALIISSIFCGLTWSEIIMPINSKNMKKYIFSILAVLLLISLFSGVFNIHPSPITKKQSMDMSNALYDGGDWLATHTSVRNTIYLMSYNAQRMRESILGFEASNPNSARNLQPHLGYGNFSSVGYSLIRTGFIPITKYDTYYYETLWPTQGSFNITDIEKLKHEDISANLVYSNGEFDVFYATKIK